MAELTDADRYIDEWTRTMLIIWREKISRLGIVRSASLYHSFSSVVDHAASGQTITMRFLQYGIWQALGTGPEFLHDNGGDLPFLGKEYREEHGLNKPRKVGPAWGGYKTSGNPRKPRDWYSSKLYISLRAMTEDLARITVQEGAQLICECLLDARHAIK